MALPPHTPVVLLAAVAGSAVGFFLWAYRDAPGAKPLAALLFAASVWSLAEGMTLASPGLEAKYFWARVVWSVSPVVPLAWLVTVLAYTGNEDALTRPRLAALTVEPAVFAFLVWTNDTHSLVWQWFDTDFVGGFVVTTETFGLAFWGHIAYSYALVAVGAALLVRLNFRTSRLFRAQSTALLVAIFLPILANALSLFRVVPPHYDLTSVGFVLTGVVVTGALMRNELMAVSPATRDIGRETLIDELDDPVIILDDTDTVVDVNPAAADLFGVDSDSVVGVDLATVDRHLASVIADTEAEQTSLELTTGDGVRYFDVRVSSLRRAFDVAAGRLVSLRDVTDRQQREQRLDVLNRLLRHNIRNEMNVVRGNAELLGAELSDADESVHDRLQNIERTVDTVVSHSDKVATLSRIVESESPNRLNLGSICRSVAETVRDRYPDATIEVDVPAGLVVDAEPSLRFAIEELLENAVEHDEGDTPRVTATADASDGGFVTVEIADTGPGLPEQERHVIEAGRETDLEHGSGIGLWLVTWIVRANGGSITFENTAEGCTVRLDLVAADADPPPNRQRGVP